MAEETITYKVEIDDSQLAARLAEIRNSIDNEIRNATLASNINNFQSIPYTTPNIGYLATPNLIQQDVSNLQTSSALVNNDISNVSTGFESFKQHSIGFIGSVRTGAGLAYDHVLPEGGFIPNVFRSFGFGYDDTSPYFRSDYVSHYSNEARSQFRDTSRSIISGALQFGIPLAISAMFPMTGLLAGAYMFGMSFYEDMAEKQDKFAETIRDLGRMGGYINASKTLGKEISKDIFEFIRENRVYDFSLDEIQSNLTDFASTGGFQFVRRAEEFKENIKAVLDNLRLVSKTLNMAQEEAARLMGELERRDIVDVASQGIFASTISSIGATSRLAGGELISFALDNVDRFRGTGKTQTEAFYDLIDARLETQKIYMAADPYSKYLQWSFGSPEAASMALIDVGNKAMSSSLGSILSYGVLGGGNVGMHYEQLLMSASSIFSGDTGDILGKLFMKNFVTGDISNQQRIAYMFQSAIDVGKTMGITIDSATDLMGLTKMLYPHMSEQEIMLGYQSLSNITEKERRAEEARKRLSRGASLSEAFSEEYVDYMFSSIQSKQYSFADVLETAGIGILDFLGTITLVKPAGQGWYEITKAAANVLSRAGQSIGDSIMGAERFRYDDMIEGLSDNALNALRDYENSDLKKQLDSIIRYHTSEKIDTKEKFKTAIDEYLSNNDLSRENREFLSNLINNVGEVKPHAIKVFDLMNARTNDPNKVIQDFKAFMNKVDNVDESYLKELKRYSYLVSRRDSIDHSIYYKNFEDVNLQYIQKEIEKLDTTGATGLSTFLSNISEEIYKFSNEYMKNVGGTDIGALNYIKLLQERNLIGPSKVLTELQSRVLTSEELSLMDSKERTDISSEINDYLFENRINATGGLGLSFKNVTLDKSTQQLLNYFSNIYSMNEENDDFTVLTGATETDFLDAGSPRYIVSPGYMDLVKSIMVMNPVDPKSSLKDISRFVDLYKTVKIEDYRTFQKDENQDKFLFEILEKSESFSEFIKVLEKDQNKEYYLTRIGKAFKDGETDIVDKFRKFNFNPKPELFSSDKYFDFLHSGAARFSYTLNLNDKYSRSTGLNFFQEMISASLDQNISPKTRAELLELQEYLNEGDYSEILEGLKDNEYRSGIQYLTATMNSPGSNLSEEQTKDMIQVLAVREKIAQELIKQGYDKFVQNKEQFNMLVNTISRNFVNSGEDFTLLDSDKMYKNLGQLIQSFEKNLDARTILSSDLGLKFRDVISVIAENTFQKDPNLRKQFDNDPEKYKQALIQKNATSLQVEYLYDIRSSLNTIVKEGIIVKEE